MVEHRKQDGIRFPKGDREIILPFQEKENKLPLSRRLILHLNESLWNRKYRSTRRHLEETMEQQDRLRQLISNPGRGKVAPYEGRKHGCQFLLPLNR